MSFRRTRLHLVVWTVVAVVAMTCLAAASVASATALASLPAPLLVTTVSLPPAQASVAFSAALSATGGTPPYLWSVASGEVPPGLVLSSLGTLSGRPGKAGVATINLRVTDSTGAMAGVTFSLTVAAAPPTPPPPQRLAALDAFGDLVQASPSAAQSILTLQGASGSPFVALAATPDGHGFYAVTAKGFVAVEGDVVSLGSIARRIAHPVVAIALDPIGSGYWLVTSDGHVYGFGDARSYGSMSRASKQRIVGIAPVAQGSGYWLVSASGQVISFGSAPSLGSVRRSRLHRDRVVAVAATTAGVGYELVTRDGKLFSFGSIRKSHLPAIVTSIGQVAGIASVQGSVGFFVVGFNGSVASVGTAQVISPLQGLSPVVGVGAGV